jgi:hypothetical protein
LECEEFLANANEREWSLPIRVIRTTVVRFLRFLREFWVSKAVSWLSGASVAALLRWVIRG